MDGRLKKVVILGGGFSGFVIARKLVQFGAVGKSCEVTVIDRAPGHLYTPWLYEVSSGFFSRQRTHEERGDLFVSANVCFHNPPGFRGVRFRRGKVKSVDPKSKNVHLDDGLSVQYDILFIGLGSEPNYFGIPGLPENCSPLKSVSDAMEIERTATELLKTATRENRKSLVVIGGGPSGVELSGELKMAMKTLERTGEIPEDTVRITIVDRAKILSMFPPSVNKRAVARFKQIGVDVLEGFSLLEARKNSLLLKGQDDQATIEYPCDVCIWAGGVMPSSVARSLPFPHDAKGKIVVDGTFSVPGFDGVFAAGDCAAVMNPHTEKPEPMTAQAAVYQGKWVAKNIYRTLHGKVLKPFPFPRRWDAVIAVGGKYGVADIQGMTFHGYIVYLMRRITDLRYFSWILPVRAAVRKWKKAVTLYTDNDG